MADPVQTAKVNAAFDMIWQERADAIAQAPFFVKSKIEAIVTHELALSRAYKMVAAIDKAEADASAKHAAAVPHPVMSFADLEP